MKVYGVVLFLPAVLGRAAYLRNTQFDQVYDPTTGQVEQEETEGKHSSDVTLGDLVELEQQVEEFLDENQEEIDALDAENGDQVQEEASSLEGGLEQIIEESGLDPDEVLDELEEMEKEFEQMSSEEQKATENGPLESASSFQDGGSLTVLQKTTYDPTTGAYNTTGAAPVAKESSATAPKSVSSFQDGGSLTMLQKTTYDPTTGAYNTTGATPVAKESSATAPESASSFQDGGSLTMLQKTTYDPTTGQYNTTENAPFAEESSTTNEEPHTGEGVGDTFQVVQTSEYDPVTKTYETEEVDEEELLNKLSGGEGTSSLSSDPSKDDEENSIDASKKSPKDIAEYVEEEADEIIHDKYVLLILVTCAVTSTAFTLFVVQQLIENPQGCLAKVCRCLVAAIRLMCWPCRMLCRCCASDQARQRHTHDRLRTSDDLGGEFA